MDIKQVARDFISGAGPASELTAGNTRKYEALMGLLEGIAEGRINKGQSLIAQLLLEEDSHKAATKSVPKDLIKKLFSSGICSNGVDLEKSGWVSR